MKLSKKLFGAYAHAFSTPEGRQVLEDLVDVSGKNDLTETRDPIELAYQAGKRDTLIYIESMINEGKH